jgi:hypothetical protein
MSVDAPCKEGQYFDAVIGSCVDCSDVCLLDLRGSRDYCCNNCPAYCEDNIRFSDLRTLQQETTTAYFWDPVFEQSVPELSPFVIIFITIVALLIAIGLVTTCVVMIEKRKRKSIEDHKAKEETEFLNEGDLKDQQSYAIYVNKESTGGEMKADIS